MSKEQSLKKDLRFRKKHTNKTSIKILGKKLGT